MGCCCSVPRSLVSKQKIRIKDDTPNGSVDLDLTVIDKNIVCMGFPATGLESWYRNPYDDVVAYLDHRWGDKYMVYNLCSEAQHVYPPEKFYGRVAYFPFPDHHACPLEMLPRFIEHVTAFLSGDASRVAVIHCKAGKGRTGLFACCLLMELVPRLSSAEDAMKYYGMARTHDGKGLTIPSQRRYVEYYGLLRRMSNGRLPSHIPTIDVKAITLRGVTNAAKSLKFLEISLPSGTFALSLEDIPREEEHDRTAAAAAEGEGEGKDERCKETTVVMFPPLTVHKRGKEASDLEGKQPPMDTVTIDVSHIPAFSNIQGDIRLSGKSGAKEKSWLLALHVHTLFIKKGYTFPEIDKLYKVKNFPQDAGIFLDYFEVIPKLDGVSTTEVPQ